MIFSFLILALLVRGQVTTQPLKVIIHFDYGSLSHIKPLMEIGNILRNRNHSVIYAASALNEKYNEPYAFEYAPLGKGFFDPVFFRNRMDVLRGARQSRGGGMVFASLTHSLPISYEDVYPRLSHVVDQTHPDVMICDFFSPACRDVAEMKGVPVVMGFQSTDGFGISRNSFITEAMAYGSITTDKLTFLERFVDKVFARLEFAYNSYSLRTALNKKRKHFGVPPSSFPLSDFSSVLGLANTFVGFEAASLLPPNIVTIGPLRTEEAPQLDADLESFLTEHPHTLYIAFGTRVILSSSDITTLLEGSLAALKEGSIDGIIWGLGSTSKEDFPSFITLNNTQVTTESLFNSPHTRLLPWVPQTAILNHNSTKVFISHGGLESMFEAIFSTTPIICMPFYGDQPRNARKVEDAGIGVYFDRIFASPSTLRGNIEKIRNDQGGRVAMNLRRMQSLAEIGSRRKELGADAVEGYAYGARICRPSLPYGYGEVPCEAQHLIPVSHRMSFIKLSLIDIYSAAIFLAASVTMVVLFASYKAYVYLFRTPIPKVKVR
ncbi:hypothetical protein DSO57_1009907 [Entomophthora muscae]|uniref:Uncharacterized protein n=1 Tax=Entomophthora muscae TaxID=34485 RepID=A0ACC2U5G5_9FUNG|nr:hypothetical protein DSO57_1009907 [Entomophthora muscae]